MRRAGLVSLVRAVATVGVLSVGIASAQQPQQAAPMQFEAAVIRPGSPPGGGVESSSSTGGDLLTRLKTLLVGGGELKLVNTPLKQWVEMGLSVKDGALKAPAWLDTSRFDLDAKLPVSGSDSAEMMKALLVERFGLKWHEESGIVSGYELVADQKVLMKPAGVLEWLPGTHGSGWGPAHLDGANMPMSELAAALGKALGKPVADRTKLSGGFDFQLNWRPESEAARAEAKQHGMDDADRFPSIFVAVREQLGLRLEVAQVPSKVIVVDNINRQPTAN